MTTLADAILQKDKKTVHRLMLSGADINEIDEYGFTPLIEAVIVNDVELVEGLMHAGAEINLQDMTGQTALHWAVENNNLQIAQSLLERGADPNMYSLACKPILLMPYLRRQKEMKQLLYYYGADLTFCKDYINAKTLGHRFELVGHADLVDTNNKFVEVNYEGFFLEFTIAAIENSLHEFKFNFASRKLRHFQKPMDIVISALKHASRLIGYQQYLTDLHEVNDDIERILSFDLTVIPVAVEGHAMTFVKFKDMLARCDRQDNSVSDDNIEIFKITRQKNFNTEFFKRLIYKKSSTQYVQHDIEVDLGLEKIDTFMIPSQIAGNCSWANVEAVIPTILYLLFQQKEDDKILNKRKAQVIFDRWREWDQNRTLHFCIESFKKAEPIARASKAEILGAVLFQGCHPDDEQSILRAQKILSVLSLKHYQYIVKNYIERYCYEAKTEEGDRFKRLLNQAGYQV